MKIALLHLSRNACWRISLLIITLAIVYISLAGFVGVTFLVPLVGWSHGILPVPDNPSAFEQRFVRWDSGYYLQIAENGYRTDGAERAFFPLYPLLTRGISNISSLSIEWSGWILSVICFSFAGLLLYWWVHDDYGAETAIWSLVWFSFFPVSFFWISFYPEALYLLLSIASIFLARRGHFFASGVCIAVAGAARPNAFLLAIPYVVEFVVQRNFRWTRWLHFGAGALIAPLGTVGYFLFLAMHADGTNPIALYNANLEQNWQMSTTWPWTTLYYGFQAAFFGKDIGTDWFSRTIVWQDLLYTLFGIAIALWAFRKLRPSMSLLLVASMIFFLTSKGPYGYVFEGMPRHVASISPMYIALAMVMMRMPPAWRWVCIVISISLLGLLSAWFATGRWVS